MSIVDLGALYLLGGVVCAATAWRRAGSYRTAGSMLTALVLWPLWAPFVLWEPRPRKRRKRRPAAERPPETKSQTTRGITAATLLEALDEAVSVARGTPFDAMLTESAAVRIAAEVNAACERLEELDVVLGEPEFDANKAEARLRQLESDGASASTQGAARMHLNNVRRLLELRRAQLGVLHELEQALAALHSQLVVAHYAGSTGEGVGAIVSELWARVEGLGEALEPESNDEEQAPQIRLEAS